jgi:hypothetical protein
MLDLKNKNEDRLKRLSDEYYDNVTKVKLSYIRSSEGIQKEMIRHQIVLEELNNKHNAFAKYPSLKLSNTYINSLFTENSFITTGDLVYHEIEDMPTALPRIYIKFRGTTYATKLGEEQERIADQKDRYVIEVPESSIESEIQQTVSLEKSIFTKSDNTQYEKPTVPIIHFNKLSPANYKVEVKEAEEPFILVFSESYHPLWQATIGETKIAEGDHFIANSYANAWLVSKTGTYTINLNFTAEDEFVKQKRNSAVFAVIALIWVGCHFFIKTRSAGQNR